MRFTFVLIFFVVLFIGCKTSAIVSPAEQQNSSTNSNMLLKQKVSNKDELYRAISNAKPGDNIIMTNGVWEDTEILFTNSGALDKPIVLSAETPGKVFLQGQSNLQLGGDYITISGLYFVNGYSPSRAVIQFSNEEAVANHCIVTNCVIEDYNKLMRNKTDLWVLLYGRYNQVDHCYFAGKSNRGPTLRVDLEGNRNINNHHKIIHNHFGPRPPKGGPSAESIQIGNSYTSVSPSYTLVADNLFDECNGEVEVISSKTNFNEFRNNVFYKSEGSLVTRHGNYCTVDGNYFIGDEETSNVGGIRLIGTGHTVTNNYFYNLRGQDFRGPLAVMNGIPKSPLNRYIQVTDVTVAYNTWIDCVEPLQFGVGSNIAQKDVLPASEIRSARPIRTVVANNVIYNSSGDKRPIVAFDKLDDILFKENVIDNQGVAFDKLDGVETASFDLVEIAEYIFAPTANFPDTEPYIGFGFEQFNNDLFGKSRETNNTVGAITGNPTMAPPILDRSNYGTDWYDTNRELPAPNTHSVEIGQDIAMFIEKAAAGDIIELVSGKYDISSSLKINKRLTIKARSNADAPVLNYSGGAATPLFEMNPGGKLTLDNIKMNGSGSQYAFASLKENMSSLYNLNMNSCVIENFDYILKAYKYSFSEDIILKGSSFKNCKNGLELSEEIEDKGEYNAENITIQRCTFENISENVIDYYRGGYDESTVGGNLIVQESTFTKCGEGEKNGILLNTYGIINVDISNNAFKDNKVKLVAQLWGAKNNSHANNTISNSGKILVEENLKLKTFY